MAADLRDDTAGTPLRHHRAAMGRYGQGMKAIAAVAPVL
jgi:hypothetical protein